MARLTTLAEGMWCATVASGLFGIHFDNRMTIVRLRNGSLFVFSPIDLDPELKQEIDALGPVAHLVGPNRFHYRSLAAWSRTYPQAQAWGARGLQAKLRRTVTVTTLPEDAPSAWADELSQIRIEGHSLNEMAFLHHASRTLIVCDLVVNFGPTAHWWTRTYLEWAGIYDRLGVSRPGRVAFKDRECSARSVDQLLTWDFDRVVPCHGRVVERDGKARLFDALDWLPLQSPRPTPREGANHRVAMHASP